MILVVIKNMTVCRQLYWLVWTQQDFFIPNGNVLLITFITETALLNVANTHVYKISI